ncbi:hypothetical protein K438DRAFT_1956219 [Mycena galopus ATCC 62051]|nr:hypothetical protein K438DRAFT_1956219 [Mycena galopus ATCC 62051]
MSGGDQRPVVLDESAYLVNRKRIEDMQKVIDAANARNEEGKRNYDRMANELQRKIQEGEEARPTANILTGFIRRKQTILTREAELGNTTSPQAKTVNTPALPGNLKAIIKTPNLKTTGSEKRLP